MLQFKIVVEGDYLVKSFLSEGVKKEDIDKKQVSSVLHEKDCWGQLVHIKNKKTLKVEGCLSDMVKDWFKTEYPEVQILQ